MSGSNYCFLPAYRFPRRQVRWSGIPISWRICQFVVIHTVKGFSIVNEVDVFLEFSCWLHDPTDVGNLISGTSAFSKFSLNIWKFSVHVLLKPSLENFEHYLASMWDECNFVLVWTFFGIGMKTDFFQSCGHCWVFHICWHFKYSTLTASAFRIWNSSSWIPSPPLVSFIVMLPKVYLTSHSRMSGSRWVITPSWLSGSWRSFLNSSSVHSCHLVLMSSASVRSLPFMFFIVPIFAWNVPLASLILLKRSLVFPILLFPSISLHWSLRRLPHLSLLFFGTLHSDVNIFPFLLCPLLLFFSQLFVRPHFTMLLFSRLGMVLITASYTMLWTSIHSSSDTVFIRSDPLNLFLTCTV